MQKGIAYHKFCGLMAPGSASCIVQLNMAEKGGSEHLPGFCEPLLLGLASDSRDCRDSVAENERGQFKEGKPDLGSYELEMEAIKKPH